MTEHWTTLTRRQAIKAGSATVAGVWGATAAGILAPQHAWAQQDPYAALRATWAAVLTGGRQYDDTAAEVRAAIDSIDTTAEQYLSTLVQDPGRPFLWDDLDFQGPALAQSSQLYRTYERLQQLALAYSTKGSRFERDPDVLEDVVSALDWMHEHKYNEDEEQHGSWFHWEIATPAALTAITTMLFDELNTERIDSYMTAVDRWCPRPAQTGANRMWRCMIVAVRGALVEDDAKLASARDGVSPVLRYVTSGDGFYRDGSFIQHGRHPYTGGYGVPLLLELSRFLHLLADSPWQVTDPNVSNVYHWAAEGYEPWLYKGSMMSPVRGRQIARRDYQDHVTGHDVTRGLMWLSTSAPPAEAQALKELVKYTIEEDTFKDFFEYSFGTSNRPANGLSSIVQAVAIASDKNLPPRGVTVRNKQYPMMDRVVHRRPDFAFAISMSSERIYTYESINQENLRGWYTGDGMHYLYNDDLAHYDDHYWATVNPYRLPGTTVPVVERPDGSGPRHLSSKQWAGGVALDTVGVAGMEFETFANLGAFTRYHLRFESDGEFVMSAWSPDGVTYVQVGEPTTIGDLQSPYIGMYAGRSDTDAPSIEARFESFSVWCGDESLNECLDASDDFDGDVLDRTRWTWIVRESPDRYWLDDGALVLPTDHGTFNNIVLQQMPTGSWRIDAVVRFAPAQRFQHAGIVVYQDDENFVRFHRIMAAAGDHFALLETRNGADEQRAQSLPMDEFDPDELVSQPEGHKSWFMFDDEIAVLGAGISSAGGHSVESIVENRKLDSTGSNRFIVNDGLQSTEVGWRETIDGVKWAHLSGTVRGTDIGYVFPNATSLDAHRELRVGKWSDVNKNPGSIDDKDELNEPRKHHYLSLWIDHGIDPNDATYAYILLPNTSPEEVRDYADEPGLEVVANSSEVQAVRSGGVIGANFWKPQRTELGDLICDDRASVLVKQSGSSLDVAVADPTHTNGGSIRVQIRRAAGRLISHDSRIEVVSLRPSIVLLVDVAGARGQAAVAQFEIGAGRTEAGGR